MHYRKVGRVLASILVAAALMTGCAAKDTDTTADTTAQTEQEESTTEAKEGYVIEDNGENMESLGGTKIYTEADLVWEENFDGDSLDTTNWNFEPHEVGWVNHESQRYVDEEENNSAAFADKNVIVQDGYLVLQAHKYVDEFGKVSYTSGRINTQYKNDFLYGRFEARLKVPYDNAFLPAFWMMPTEEGLYGQWPKCGEIDIMEVLGQATDTSYATIHYGEPHTESQGSKKLDGGDFSKEFHVFACEWDPGEVRFYVDGELILTENDWFTKKIGYGEVTYPAPFDQPFYMILNLAVGGTWPGDPDPDGEFGDNAQMVVDYVRVYQKSEYDTNVEKPIKEVTFKEPDESGNYLNNGDFSEAEALDDTTDWFFLTAGSGKASASIHDNEIQIDTEKPGELDYSVQLVQPGMPMIKGNVYRLSFDAYADEERTMKTAVTAPDVSWIRYLEDTQITVGTEKETFTFEFEMHDEDDANGRVEFNMGNQPSSATLHISNVRLEVIDTFDIGESRHILPNGNFVFNGEFQEGKDRLDYWETENNCDGAEVYVTNINNVRELCAVVPDTVGSIEDVTVKQAVEVEAATRYVLIFYAYADTPKTIQVNLGGTVVDVELTTEQEKYRLLIDMPEQMNSPELQFHLGVPGEVYIDNVEIHD